MPFKEKLAELAGGAARHGRIEIEFAVRLDQLLKIFVLDLVLYICKRGKPLLETAIFM
jgi:hypothetical protein